MDQTEKKTLEQRTCNIILCCKGYCRLGPEHKCLPARKAIARYMSKECACPEETYTDRLIYQILKTAAIDFFRHADNPGYQLWQLLDDPATHEPTMSERIITMFSLTDVKRRNDDGTYSCTNGFTEKLIAAGEKYLSTDEE